MDRIIRIPRFLYHFHGENPTRLDLILTYTAALIAGGQVLFITRMPDIWRTVLLALLFADLGGGIVANLTASTKRYYHVNRRKRFSFLLLHLLYPIAFAVIFPVNVKAYLITGTLIVLSALIVNAIKQKGRQPAAAGAFFVAALLLNTMYSPHASFFQALFIPMMSLKLIVAFAVEERED